MNTLYLIRHSLTEANERRLYGGSTDIPLSERGREVAIKRRGVLPDCDLYATSGMLRAVETLELMTGKKPGLTLDGLREMDFGAFEMKSYDDLKEDPDYIHWIEDETGDVSCPDGESRNQFKKRVLDSGNLLVTLDAGKVCVVCHGGTIVNLMQAWFPEIERNFYEWQPGACGGYRITVTDGAATVFEEV